jgi:hypothetical protein
MILLEDVAWCIDLHWGGLCAKLAKKGVILDLEFTRFTRGLCRVVNPEVSRGRVGRCV